MTLLTVIAFVAICRGRFYSRQAQRVKLNTMGFMRLGDIRIAGPIAVTEIWCDRDRIENSLL